MTSYDFVTFVVAPSSEQHLNSPKSIDSYLSPKEVYQCRTPHCCEVAGSRTAKVFGKDDPKMDVDGRSRTAVWQCADTPPAGVMQRGFAGARPVTGGLRHSTLDPYSYHWRFTFYLGDFTDYALLAQILPASLVERAQILAAAKPETSNCPVDYRTGTRTSVCASYFSDTIQGSFFRSLFPKGSKQYQQIAEEACRNYPSLYNCICKNRHLYKEYRRMKAFPGVGPDHCWFVPCSRGLSDFFVDRDQTTDPCRGAECMVVVKLQAKDATLKNNSIVQQCSSGTDTHTSGPTRPVLPPPVVVPEKVVPKTVPRPRPVLATRWQFALGLAAVTILFFLFATNR